MKHHEIKRNIGSVTDTKRDSCRRDATFLILLQRLRTETTGSFCGTMQLRVLATAADDAGVRSALRDPGETHRPHPEGPPAIAAASARELQAELAVQHLPVECRCVAARRVQSELLQALARARRRHFSSSWGWLAHIYGEIDTLHGCHRQNHLYSPDYWRYLLAH